MASKRGVIRGLVALALVGAAAKPVTGMIMAEFAGPAVETTASLSALDALPAARKAALERAHASSASTRVHFAAADTGWVDEFERFAAQRPPADVAAQTAAAPEASDRNTLSVAKAAPGLDPADTALEPSLPKDMPKAAAALDDGSLKTGSVRPGHQPLLPPVPSPEAYRMLKGDRLGADRPAAPARVDPVQPMPGAVPDAVGAPHAELAPGRAGAALAPVRMAQVVLSRGDRTKPTEVASIAMKPFDLAPARPDPVFQGPPMPADPKIDADAPVLGYAEQVSSVEAPFKALFAVSPVTKQSWLAGEAAKPKSKATKPARLAHLPHHSTRRHAQG